MDITPYVDHLRRDLLTAAEGAGEELRSAAERLGFALDPAARLALMEAISQACSEITAEMPAGGVDVRLDGRDLAFVVDAPTAGPPVPPAPPTPPLPPEPEEETESGGTARITLRLPESVKAKAEDAAADAGQSLNTWLVSVIRAATRPGGINVDIDLSSLPQLLGDNFPFGSGGPPGSGRGRTSSKRMNGWV
ncbi:MAG: toxin-antitoxin system HicB family antitoxin [Nocardioides sp.]|uniref:toxin-antitoxin system HicB family antitoxin n=1 Tax=Nocardioides sp. TaxID=35761 RepID=UPI00239A7D4A|nr:toxin-antitoxin system HicB family antitoxin [Nocardioides sp.]MDE0776230.1 toxin-antitoxin system HicB family antitoxin [Nocardioides sp.]